ncbi:MAG: hypothetical protein ACE5Q6_14430 [Dehalococcoidia bacterium]
MPNRYGLAWDYLVELRKEIVNSQRLRVQLVGLKITAVLVASAFIAASIPDDTTVLEAIVKFRAMLVAVAFGAIFFDLLIAGLSMSINRMGFYIKEFLEPCLKEEVDWPINKPLWEYFEATQIPGKSPSGLLGNISNLGLTGILVLATFLLGVEDFFNQLLWLVALIPLAILYLADLWVARHWSIKPFEGRPPSSYEPKE